MKYILLILIAFSAQAQTISVKFYGPGNVAGLPAYWPQVVRLGTNAPSGYVTMSAAQLEEIVSTNRAAYATWESNRTYQVQAAKDAALADFLTKMDKIESWIDKTTGTNSLTNNQRDNAINDVCQTFRKLRSVLKMLYQSDL